MGKFIFLFFALILSINFTEIFAQSRSQTDLIKQKSNTHSPEITPTPPQTENLSKTSENIADIQQKSTTESLKDDEILRIDTDLITVPVKVSDRNGRLISGLKIENFKVFENNIEQEVSYFSNEEQPFTVALVLDVSYSSKFKINEIQSAANAFVARLRPNDKVMIVSFDEEVHVLCEPTNNRNTLLSAIRNTKIDNGTSLYEAIDLVINQKFKKISGRKAIVLFTDGVDTTSKLASNLSNESDASELDALIYPIQYDTFSDVQRMKNKSAGADSSQKIAIPASLKVDSENNQGTTVEDYRKAGKYLEAMANRTGGRVYQATTAGNLTDAFSNIADELRQFYSLGYYPQIEGKQGEKRKIKVRVNQTKLAVQSRDSYIIGKK